MTADRPPLPPEITAAIDALVWAQEEYDDAIYAPDRKGDPPYAPVDAARARLEALIAGLVECLRWYVDTDETNEGMPGNEFWEVGLNRARAVLGIAKDDGIEKWTFHPPTT